MVREDGLGRRVLEHAVFDHGLRPAHVLFGRLEYEDDRTGHLGADHGKCLCKGESHRRVYVVAADVPHPGILRREVDGIGRCRAHGVHVGPESDDRSCAAPAQDSDHSVPADSLPHLEAQSSEPRCDKRGRARLLFRELRMPVNVSSHCDQTVAELIHPAARSLVEALLRVSG